MPRLLNATRGFTTTNYSRKAQKWHGLLAGLLGFVSESQLAVV